MAGTNVYQMVTDRIISELEKGHIPWQKPWTGTSDSAYSLVTKKPYSLLNQMLLGRSGAWATFKQITAKGGKIKKGEKSSICVFWKMLDVKETDENGNEVKKTIPYLQYYNVFHVRTQTTGIEIPEDEPVLTDIEPIEEAEKVFQAYINREGITLEQDVSDDAYFSPSRDLIHLPMLNQFTDSSEYYSTAFHEAVHSTGSAKRLNRAELTKTAGFGSQTYSKEELTAEIGSATILHILGIETPQSFKNNVAYIESWLKVLRNDNKFIVGASSRAEKAVEYILGEA